MDAVLGRKINLQPVLTNNARGHLIFKRNSAVASWLKLILLLLYAKRNNFHFVDCKSRVTVHTRCKFSGVL